MMADSSSLGTCQAEESGRAGTSVRLEDPSLSRKDGGQLGSWSQTQARRRGEAPPRTGSGADQAGSPPGLWPFPLGPFLLQIVGADTSKAVQLGHQSKWSSSELTRACCGWSTPQIVGGDWCRCERVTQTCGLENLVRS